MRGFIWDLVGILNLPYPTPQLPVFLDPPPPGLGHKILTHNQLIPKAQVPPPLGETYNILGHKGPFTIPTWLSPKKILLKRPDGL